MPDFSLVNMILIAIAGMLGLFGGVVIGYYLSGTRQPEEVSRQPENMKEVARVWSDRSTGQLAVEIEHRLYRHQRELGSRQRSALAALHDRLQNWLGIDDIPGRVQPGATDVAKTARTAQPSEPSIRPTLVPTPFARPEIISPGLNTASNPPSLDLRDILTDALVPVPGKPNPSVFKSIAAQVDGIVQEKLPDSSFAGRMIGLHDQPDGTMFVVVDGERFEGINDVADPAVRAFLQDCVNEWERRAHKSA